MNKLHNIRWRAQGTHAPLYRLRVSECIPCHDDFHTSAGEGNKESTRWYYSLSILAWNWPGSLVLCGLRLKERVLALVGLGEVALYKIR